MDTYPSFCGSQSPCGRAAAASGSQPRLVGTRSRQLNYNSVFTTLLTQLNVIYPLMVGISKVKSYILTM